MRPRAFALFACLLVAVMSWTSASTAAAGTTKSTSALQHLRRVFSDRARGYHWVQMLSRFDLSNMVETTMNPKQQQQEKEKIWSTNPEQPVVRWIQHRFFDCQGKCDLKHGTWDSQHQLASLGYKKGEVQQIIKKKDTSQKFDNGKIRQDVPMWLEKVVNVKHLNKNLDPKPKFGTHWIQLAVDQKTVPDPKGFPDVEGGDEKHQEELLALSADIVTKVLADNELACEEKTLECPPTGLQLRPGGKGTKSGLVHTDADPPEELVSGLQDWWHNLYRQFKFKDPEGKDWSNKKYGGKEGMEKHLEEWQYFNMWVCYKNCDQRAFILLYNGGAKDEKDRTWYSTAKIQPGRVVVFDGFFHVPHSGEETEKFNRNTADGRISAEMRCRCKKGKGNWPKVQAGWAYL